MKVTIPYKQREWAKEFHSAKERWKVLVMHRRSGKTTACVNHLIRDALTTKDSRYAYIAPYYKQAKTVAWDMLKHYSRPIPDTKFNESELRVDYPNGSRIQLFGADNPDALRGLGLWGVIFDEYSQQPSSIFTEVVRPALADHKGYAIWIGTPKGRNDFYRIYDENRDKENWYVKLLRASESGIVDEDELKDAQSNMSLDEYAQEFECSFDAAIKGAYYSAQLQDCRREGRVTTVKYQPEATVDTYWDLGMSDYTCIIFAQKIGKEIHIIDYYENNNMSLDQYALELRKKPYLYNRHYLPHDIRVKELGTGRSRYEMLGKQLGVGTLDVLPALGLKEGIEAGRKIFPRCWFDKDKCAGLLDALASYTQEWDDKKGMFKDKPLHNWASHASDAFRYLSIGLKDQIVTKSRSIKSSKYNPRKCQSVGWLS